GRQTGDDVLRHVVRRTRAGLRLADILFRFGSDEFVALLNATDSDTAASVATRIRDSIRGHDFSLRGGGSLTVEATVTCACAPKDGRSFRDLLEIARHRVASSAVEFE